MRETRHARYPMWGVEGLWVSTPGRTPRAGLKGEGFRPEEGRKVGVEGGYLPPGPQPIDSPTRAPFPLERKKNLRGPAPGGRHLKTPGPRPPGRPPKTSVASAHGGILFKPS